MNAAGASIASGATVNLANATGVSLTITGTVTITSFGTVAAGAERVLTFAGILTLTYNATSLILPGAANIVTAANDVATFRSLGGGNWRCVAYQRASGAALAIPASSTIVTPNLTLKQSAAPFPSADGSIEWDTDDNVLLIGDGAGPQTFVPFPASVVAGDLFYAASSKALIRLPKGTTLQQLRMNAGATAPEWFTPSASILANLTFTMAGTAITIVKNFNIASVVRNSAGTFTITFTNAMPDANYSVFGSSRLQGASESWSFQAASKATGSCQISNKQVGGVGPADVDYLNFTVIG